MTNDPLEEIIDAMIKTGKGRIWKFEDLPEMIEKVLSPRTEDDQDRVAEMILRDLQTLRQAYVRAEVKLMNELRKVCKHPSQAMTDDVLAGKKQRMRCTVCDKEL